MDELPELNKSLEQIEVILKELRASNKIPCKPPGQPSFSDIALGNRLKFDLAVSIVLSRSEGYQAIREVLFMGICGFVIAPNDELLDKLYMARGIIDYLYNNEFIDLKEEKTDFAYDFIVRYAHIGMDFFSDIYYPLNKAEMFTFSVARDTLTYHISEYKGFVDRIVLCCSVMHFAKDKFGSQEKYHKLSQNRLVAILSEFPVERRTSRSTLLAAWAHYKSVLALLYAASTILHKKSSLLEAIVSGEVRAADYLLRFDEWFGKAKYFSDHVIPDLEIDGLHKINAKPLKNIPPVRFSAPSFTPEEEGIIIANFLKKKRVKPAGAVS